MISLNKENFWGWMKYAPNSKNDKEFWGVFNKLFKFDDANNRIDCGYIVEELTEKHPFESSKIMGNLFQLMPREYFREVQFCAMTYTAFFSKICPLLADKIDNLAYIEWLMYLESEKLDYRDHFVHMFKVTFAGIQLLEDNGNALLNKIAKSQFERNHFTDWAKVPKRKMNLDGYDEKSKQDILKRAFFFAAIFHDIGFGSYFLGKYKRRLHGLCLPGRDSVDISEDQKKVILGSLPAKFVENNHYWLNSQKRNNELYEKVKNDIIIGFFKDSLSLNHSVASCLCVLEIAEKLKRARAIPADIYLSFQIAAEAIMLHDMTSMKKGWAHFKCKKRPHFLFPEIHNDVPIAILLILADELAIWDRHRLKGTPKEKGVVFRYDKEWTQTEGIPSEIRIEVQESKIIITAIIDKESEGSKLEEELNDLLVFGVKGKQKFMDLNLEINNVREMKVINETPF